MQRSICVAMVPATIADGPLRTSAVLEIAAAQHSENGHSFSGSGARHDATGFRQLLAGLRDLRRSRPPASVGKTDSADVNVDGSASRFCRVISVI